MGEFRACSPEVSDKPLSSIFREAVGASEFYSDPMQTGEGWLPEALGERQELHRQLILALDMKTIP